jgi:hypothetical protein
MVLALERALAFSAGVGLGSQVGGDRFRGHDFCMSYLVICSELGPKKILLYSSESKRLG